MSKIAQWAGFLCLVALAVSAVSFSIYGQYQQSQLYPALHQQIGFQQCVTQVNAEMAQQQAPPSQSNQSTQDEENIDNN